MLHLQVIGHFQAAKPDLALHNPNCTQRRLHFLLVSIVLKRDIEIGPDLLLLFTVEPYTGPWPQSGATDPSL